ncbi:MAG: TrkH family potassium uptake protein, partial [Desulfobacula sp.]|nr:TrkH family potassium uptake protein [Desulfobacula sp.]
MNYKTIANVLGKLLIVTGISMVFPLICSLFYQEDDLYAITITGILTLGLGYPLWWFFRRYQDLNIKDGFFIAFFGWVMISAVSALPFMIHGSIPFFTDAFFEMMSGYTTTGATILTDIEVVPHGLLFW